MATGFLYDERFLDHDAGAGHPERRERLSSTMAHLQAQAWFEQLRMLTPRVADEDEVGEREVPVDDTTAVSIFDGVGELLEDVETPPHR